MSPIAVLLARIEAGNRERTAFVDAMEAVMKPVTEEVRPTVLCWHAGAIVVCDRFSGVCRSQ